MTFSRIAAVAVAVLAITGLGDRARAAVAPCQSRPDLTLPALLSCVEIHALWKHLSTFQAIADANPDGGGHGNRDTGTSGYAKSVGYVAGELRRAGYTVTIQPYMIGAGLAPGHGGPHAMAPVALAKPVIDYNVIAEVPYGDPHHTIVVDAHLDSIFGAGMLDNASGSATNLEIALLMAKVPTRNHLRWVWFGGEELGLYGSRYYTRQMSSAERADTAFDLDVDVTATPNYDILVADPGHAGNSTRFPANVIPQSQRGNDLFLNYFQSVGVAARLANFGNDGTDSNSFSLVGIPNTGILTNQDCCKRAWEVGIWGGVRGNYEGKIPSTDGGCVDQPRRWCDNLSNNAPVIFELVSKAVAYTVWRLANDPP